VVTIQYTVVGQVGVNGVHALSPVIPVLKNVLEPVPVPLHVMAGTFALETRGKNNCATRSHALVRNELFVVHYFFFVNFFKICFLLISIGKVCITRSGLVNHEIREMDL